MERVSSAGSQPAHQVWADRLHLVTFASLVVLGLCEEWRSTRPLGHKVLSITLCYAPFALMCYVAFRDATGTCSRG